MKTLVMSFSQFFDPETDQIYKMIDESKKIMEENQKLIDYNNEILHAPPQNFWQRGQYHPPQGDTTGTLQNISDSLQKIGHTIDRINYYLNNPYELFKVIIIGIATASYYVCLTICLWCVIIYVLSEAEKAKKCGVISFCIYLALQILKMAL